MTAKIHKSGKQNVPVYQAWGVYEKVKAPLCVGAKMVWRGKSYCVTRLWKNVTCKHCLNRYNRLVLEKLDKGE